MPLQGIDRNIINESYRRSRITNQVPLKAQIENELSFPIGVT